MARGARRGLAWASVLLLTTACRGHARLPTPPDLPPAQRRARAGPPTKSLQHYALGVLAWQVGELGEAAEHVGIALAFDPHSAWLHRTRGRIAMDRGDLDEAVAALSHAVTLDPDDVETQRILARALALRGDTEDADRLLDQLLARQRDDRAFADLAQLRLFNGDRQGSAEVLEAWAQQPPESLTLLRERAFLRLEHGQAWEAWDDLALLAEAGLATGRDLDRLLEATHATKRNRSTLELLERLASWDPGDQELLVRLANLAEQLGDSCRSARAWERMEDLEGDPEPLRQLQRVEATLNCSGGVEAAALLQAVEPAEARALLDGLPMAEKLGARILHHQGQGEQALALLARETDDSARIFVFDLQAEILEGWPDPELAIELAREAWEGLDFGAVRPTLARLYARAGALDEARELVDFEARTRPEDQLRVARMQWQAGERDAALETLAAAEDRWPDEVFLALERIRWLVELERLDDAHALAAGAAARFPELPACARQLAWVEHERGEIESATALLEAAHEQHPDDPGIMNDLAYLKVEAGDGSDPVLAMAERAVDQQPARAAYLDTLGWILLSRGEAQAALHELLHAARLAPDDPVIAEHLALARAEAAKTE